MPTRVRAFENLLPQSLVASLLVERSRVGAEGSGTVASVPCGPYTRIGEYVKTLNAAVGRDVFSWSKRRDGRVVAERMTSEQILEIQEVNEFVVWCRGVLVNIS